MASSGPTPAERTATFLLGLLNRGELGKWAAELVLSPPWGYLADARKAFDLDMNEAASLLCRASIEAALYTFVYLEPAIGSESPTPLLLKKPDERDTFLSLLNKAAGVEFAAVKLLSDSDREGLLLIEKHGNTVAHVIERLHRAFLSIGSLSVQVDFPFPARSEVERDLALAKEVLSKLRDRLAIRLQAEAASHRERLEGIGPGGPA